MITTITITIIIINTTLLTWLPHLRYPWPANSMLPWFFHQQPLRFRQYGWFFCVNRYGQKNILTKSSMFPFHFFKVNSRSWTFFAAFWTDFVFNQMSQRPKQHLASYSLIPRVASCVPSSCDRSDPKKKITGPHGTKTQDVRANQNHLPFGNNIEQHPATAAS